MLPTSVKAHVTGQFHCCGCFPPDPVGGSLKLDRTQHYSDTAPNCCKPADKNVISLINSGVNLPVHKSDQSVNKRIIMGTCFLSDRQNYLNVDR